MPPFGRSLQLRAAYVRVARRPPRTRSAAARADRRHARRGLRPTGAREPSHARARRCSDSLARWRGCRRRAGAPSAAPPSCSDAWRSARASRRPRRLGDEPARPRWPRTPTRGADAEVARRRRPPSARSARGGRRVGRRLAQVLLLRLLQQRRHDVRGRDVGAHGPDHADRVARGREYVASSATSSVYNDHLDLELQEDASARSSRGRVYVSSSSAAIAASANWESVRRDLAARSTAVRNAMNSSRRPSAGAAPRRRRLVAPRDVAEAVCPAASAVKAGRRARALARVLRASPRSSWPADDARV